METSPASAESIKVLVTEVPNLLAAVVRGALNKEPDMEVVSEPFAPELRALVDVVVTAAATTDLAPQFREILFGPQPVPVVVISVDGKRIGIYGRSETRGGGIEWLASSIREAVIQSRPRPGGMP